MEHAACLLWGSFRSSGADQLLKTKVWGSSLCLGTWALAAGLGLTTKQPKGKEASPGLGGSNAERVPCLCWSQALHLLMQSGLTSYIRFLSARASLCRGEMAKGSSSSRAAPKGRHSGWQMEETAVNARLW